MKVLTTALKTILLLAVVVIILVAGYVAYVAIQYYRIEDNFSLEINNNQSERVAVGQNYTITTYNIGFGAYTQDFSFFMDSGEMLDGTKVTGQNSKAKDKDTVLTNTNGAIAAIKAQNVDFAFFQEVDRDGDRSRHVNQFEMITNGFSDFSGVYAQNFHSAYLFYPFNDPHGKTDAGLVTLSSKYAESSVRRSFPVDNSFFNKFFDLDRCFSITYLPIENSEKMLCLVNIHMSAYDEGGLIRQQQLKMINDVLSAEVKKGNYVVAGGDFNHDIANSVDLFETQQKKPEWVYELSDENLADGLRFVSASNAPTCRSTDMPYEKGVNYSVVLDGFIVSDNVEAIEVANIDTDFAFSDHNPAKMTFRLK